MPLWTPQPVWQGLDCFIIGGGTSLRDFDWNLLKNERVIGCNNAFRLGEEVVDYVVFCDKKLFWDGKKPRKGFYDGIASFSNPVITNDNQLKNKQEPWLKYIPRLVKGFSSTPDFLCFNGNTGAAAINLACLLGATTIYLLGYDMHLDNKGEPNWHKWLIDKAAEEVYARFLTKFGYVSKGVKEKFPDCKVINVNKDSNLKLFPIIDPDIFWKERRPKDVLDVG